MPTTFVYYVAMSLDGRIAAPDHSVAFLDTLAEGEPAGDFAAFEAGIDAMVMGARTWDFLVRHGSWPHGDRPVWVVTNRASVPTLPGASMRLHAGPIANLIAVLRSHGFERVWVVGGGNVAAQFAAEDAIDELILTIAPTMLAKGPALFDAPAVLATRPFTLTKLERYGAAGARLEYHRTR